LIVLKNNQNYILTLLNTFYDFFVILKKVTNIMKQQVKLSTYSAIKSWLLPFFLVALSVYGNRGEMPNWMAYMLGFSAIVLICLGFYYMPMSISVDRSAIKIRRILRIKNIPIRDVERIDECAPTIAEVRLCGSNGCFGYWGWFKEPSIGRYFAYYGKASDCFLVTLKSGWKYLLGCKNHKDIVEFISKKIDL
jgi:hypothetical protein